MSALNWPAMQTALIGLRVARRRRQLRISARVLSERCAESGWPIPRNTITNLENGRKQTIPFHELAVIADALGMSLDELARP